MGLLHYMKASGLQPDLFAYSVTADLYRWLGKWRRALDLLESMHQDDGIQPDLVIYTTVMAACGEAGHWEETWTLFKVCMAKRAQTEARFLL